MPKKLYTAEQLREVAKQGVRKGIDLAVRYETRDDFPEGAVEQEIEEAISDVLDGNDQRTPAPMKCNKPECYRNGNLCEHTDDCPEQEGSGADACSAGEGEAYTEELILGWRTKAANLERKSRASSENYLDYKASAELGEAAAYRKCAEDLEQRMLSDRRNDQVKS